MRRKLCLFALLVADIQVVAFHTSEFAHRILTSRRDFHVCRLNRFLFAPEEIDTDENTVTLPKDDYRTQHAAKVLGAQNGDSIRAGIISSLDDHGWTTDDATIEWIPEGKAETKKHNTNQSLLRVHLQSLEPAIEADIPPVSLILALPRPLQLGRMLPMIAQMGVDELILTDAQKVPKDYFGSHLFRKPHLLRERLVEGLCQAGDVRLPRVTVCRSLERFLRNDLETMFSPAEYSRVIAHPERKHTSTRRISDTVKKRKVLVAVGPEGGWTEPEELQLFQNHGFEQVTMGPRVFRSDCAVVSLLSLAHDACATNAEKYRRSISY